MHEPITLVKVRKDTTVKIPAGGWLVLRSPDQAFAEHVAARTALVAAGHVHEDYERLIIGRLADSHTPTRFVTAAEKKSSEDARAADEKKFSDHTAEALKREKKQKAEADKVLAAEHEAKVEAINKQNDATRSR